MRKLTAAVAIAALAIAVSASSASAQTVTKFSVIAIGHGHRTSSGFVVKGRLVEPGERSEVVGAFKAEFSGPNAGHVRLVAFFPDGKLKANGRIAPGDHKVPIIGGTRRWNGASGKVIARSAGRNAERLTFTVVQG
jgi:hypothetical protein